MLALCGIGHPDAFLRHAERHGISVKAAIVGPDHMPFDRRFLLEVFEKAAESGADAILI